ncbi:hypothetical protein D8B26_004017 [Coccidioides posadasii str. Silveira]|uniref:Uncharacterized protein n=2 Tax=Coccidioides posadasii TaxID=199306 RepID=E9DDM8_COCPS|nr:hypothetical protein CPC735_071220 [Coccidioides posadasii C735 delta SOWgp]EER29440.1 hypothetical protein CPC735_071220 [Coccidioides posadasii C735 delta SOWgp]EFW15232.1 conserved hypothetical protein [Coccidioides posadasii str. Silveira]QVM09356.1 hypothetical protein D8B26_004017 [Coccidioides posadasii str. Silveira]|eukprot:XP_003071585.1 hypothetical protein CPC735_071220 [Coccidioides posadasii C735 delta SOWgp]
MSGAGDDRWRGGRGYDPNRPAGQRHHSAGFRDRSMGGHQQDRHGQRGQGNIMNAGNAWGGPAQEPHIPVRGFNGAELKDALRKGYEPAGPGEPQPMAYKSNGKDANNIRSSGPWASKPNTMVNGKDFFLELRKQISGLQQSGNVPGG